MRRGLPSDGARDVRLRRAASPARASSKSARPSAAPWWPQVLLWIAMLASAPLLRPTFADGASAFCGFLALWMSYRLALRFAAPKAALVATIAIWLATSLPVHVYLVPFTTGVAAMFAHRPTMNWAQPQLAATALSAAYDALICTPVLVLAVVGLAVAVRRRPAAGFALAAVGALFFYLAAAHGGPVMSSYGSRLLIVLIPVLVCGLAPLVDTLVGRRGRLAWAGALSVVLMLVLWNAGMILQWRTGLIPERGPVNGRQAAAHQVTAVPSAVRGFVIRYVNGWNGLVKSLARGAHE